MTSEDDEKMSDEHFGMLTRSAGKRENENVDENPDKGKEQKGDDQK